MVECHVLTLIHHDLPALCTMAVKQDAFHIATFTTAYGHDYCPISRVVVNHTASINFGTFLNTPHIDVPINHSSCGNINSPAIFHIELVAARQMVRLAAWKLDNRSPDATTYCAMAKRFATDIGFKVANDALQLHGGYGYIKEYPLERHVRDNRVHQILEGTNEIMRVIVARAALQEGALERLR